MTITEQDIISCARKGNDEAVLSFLYKEVLPKVRHYILSNKGNEDETKDIFQDAVIIFYKKLKMNELDDNINVTGYVCLIAKNLWINRVKKINRQAMFEGETDIASDENIEKDIITNEKESAIKILMSRIGEECRRLLKLSVYENLSMKEICRRMGYSNENVAKTYNYRCKQKLAQLVRENQSISNLLKNEH
ncbi:MAG: RNA polymerase sigma factor [Cytophagaceae bacterium]